MSMEKVETFTNETGLLKIELILQTQDFEVFSASMISEKFYNLPSVKIPSILKGLK